MCTRLYCDDPLTEINSVRDLLAFVPVDFIVLHDEVLRPGQNKEDFIKEEGHTCLCSVNIQASFFGSKKWKLAPDEDGIPGDWLIVSHDDGSDA